MAENGSTRSAGGDSDAWALCLISSGGIGLYWAGLIRDVHRLLNAAPVHPDRRVVGVGEHTYPLHRPRQACVRRDRASASSQPQPADSGSQVGHCTSRSSLGGAPRSRCATGSGCDAFARPAPPALSMGSGQAFGGHGTTAGPDGPPRPRTDAQRRPPGDPAFLRDRLRVHVVGAVRPRERSGGDSSCSRRSMMATRRRWVNVEERASTATRRCGHESKGDGRAEPP
jgi:hypothetical protein